jgi:hypothetical protein
MAAMTCGLYYKHMTIVTDDYSIVNKLGASLTDDARVVIYGRHVFIDQATACQGPYSQHFIFFVTYEWAQ